MRSDLKTISQKQIGGDVMTEQKADACIAVAVVSLTKSIMEYYSIGQEEAYKKIVTTRLFQLLNNSQTGLFLEPNWYLKEACVIELEKGKDEMVKYITDMSDMDTIRNEEIE